MGVDDLLQLTLADAAAALEAGRLSSLELTTAYLERIEKHDPALHAYLYVDREGALERAAAADTRYRESHQRRSKQPKTPLLGIPIAVKDVLCVAGMPCTCGSRILEGFIPPYHATSVARLWEAGAVILGKTNTDEFAMGSSTENSAYGATRNPWNIDRVPGGSSGGSAAAVAGRLALAALGTDTGGSVRQPAAFCGVTGIKPTYGRVSRYGLVAYGSSLDVVGALGRDVRDSALLFGAIAGNDPRDSTTAEAAVPEILLEDSPELAGVTVGVPDEYFIEGIQPEVEARVREALETMEQLGAAVERVRMPHTEYAVPVYYIIAPAEASANLARYDGVRYGPRVAAEEMWEVLRGTRGEKFGPEVKRRIMLGTYALSAGYFDAYYGQAQKVRTLIRQDFEQAFEQVDVIAAPVAPTTAFGFGEHTEDPLSMYLEDVFSLPANLAGVPGVTVPVGFDAAGLPVGMQLMGPPFGEASLLRVAHAYQTVTDWHRRSPPDPV